MNLSTPIEQISGIGPVFQKKLKRLGIRTIQDIFYHFPHRYEDFSNIKNIAEIKIGETCSIRGKILKIENIRTWKRRMFLTQSVVQDQTGILPVVWFNQPYLTKILKEGNSVCLAGKTTSGKEGIYLSNPVYEIADEADLQIHTGRLVAVYPETERLSSRWLRKIISPILAQLKNSIPDPLSLPLIKEHNLLSLPNALWQIHFPDSLELAKKAQERFAFEELFLIQLWALRERMRLSQEKAVGVPLDLKLVQKLVNSLPFKLTDAQKKSAWQILKDLEKPRPMNRLLEGDVGSGKTVVAAIAILNVLKAGHQAALMAPTEILAKQHFKTIWDLLQNFKINVGLLTGKTDKFYSKKLKNQDIEISRKKLLEKTINGEINLIIGTHALIQDKVKFGDLALVIVDEQHRFGVEQRARLCQPFGHATSKCDLDVACPNSLTIPHLLSMTATPIPRTLALTIYGDLDLSLINQSPKGRKKIITQVVQPQERQKTYDFIRKEIKNGRQAFVICPRIEFTEKSDVRAVKEEYEKLSKKIFPDLKVGMLHGKLTGLEKEKIMKDFKFKKIDILVSTSVVEVGVDVPNASCMMIEGSERFGLAQLHQFRGRVGRAEHQSYCFLLTDSPAKSIYQRLKALVNCENGFELAEKDLQMRGPGDFSGKRQWGIADLAMNSLSNVALIEKTRQSAKEIIASDPFLKQHQILQKRLDNFREKIHLE